MAGFPDPPDPLDEAFPLGDGTADGVAFAACPYCGEQCEIVLDPGGGSHQEYVEDCPVCCRPWRVRVAWAGGVASVSLATEDE
jgi:hypothetical protein